MTATLALLTALLLTFGLVVSLWPNVAVQRGNARRIVLTGFDGGGVVVAFALFVLAAWMVGPAVSASVLITLFLYELGQALARRSLGAGQARLRMVPIPFLAARARRSNDPAAEAFVILMGAGLCIAPMTLAFAVAQLTVQSAPELARLAQTFAVTCGAVNFIMLMPFMPLDGGRCVQAVSRSFWPALGPGITCFMVAAFASAAIQNQSVGCLVLAGIGLQGLLPRRQITALPLSPNTALLVLATYSFVLATHFAGGWWILKGLL